MPATWSPSRLVTNDHILPYVDSKDLSTPEASRDALNTLPFERNVFKLLANSPVFFPKFMALLGACFSPNKALRPSDWQLTVLLTSRILNAPYVWDVNAPLAKLLPTFEPWDTIMPKIAERDLQDRDTFTDRQRLIVRFCEEYHGPQNVVAAETMRLLETEGFSPKEVMELFMIAGIYGTLAKTMVSAKIDFDEVIPGLEDMLRSTFEGEIRRDSEHVELKEYCIGDRS